MRVTEPVHAYLQLHHRLTPNGLVLQSVRITSDPIPGGLLNVDVWSEVRWARTSGQNFHEALTKMQRNAERNQMLASLLRLSGDLP